MSARTIIIVPTLNEARHIGGLLQALMVEAEALDARIVVADGGSTDGTIDIVAAIAISVPRVVLIHNPQRIQSAAINLAVEQFGDGAEYFIRIDAHDSMVLPGSYATGRSDRST